ncbi:uncharacterized protein LOC101740511 [Bombyx mori]|uniref:DUF4776 domain-containing protein n=1 Tax=Bombyx mori TaxID=7091 RepID=A0A8R2AK24_BOMMO|nr:uncharacterized protein LOC101740511 [Bombyx mori]
MAVSNAMFLFEVVVESVKSLVESRHLVIRSDFADIFSLELKDPKQMHITMPEPPPLPPEPPGKKGKKKAAPKKGKKGKGKGKGKVEEPPPEPAIQSGQSVLFSSTAEFLLQNMKKFPMEVSLWSKEENLAFIGATFIPWDPMFLSYLEKIYNCQEPPPVTLKEEYNVFEEGTAKLMAKLGIQIKLSYLSDRVTVAFRTLTEDPAVKKYLYTGINSKTTSYMCTMKTTDEIFEENSNKIDNNYVVDKPKTDTKIVYADYKNAPGANLSFFKEGDYCCMGKADKPPDSLYKAPEKCPDVNFIIDYVRNIIISCNDNMRMLTPRPTIRPRIRATDIDRLCYCKETAWPEGKLAEHFRNEVQSGPCPICTKGDTSKIGGTGRVNFDVANIRGPCGRPDCRIARDIRAYIENLVEEDNREFNINEIVGPCGSKTCTLAAKIQEFLRHEGPFTQGTTLEGLSTQCACVKQMQEALTKKKSCDSLCEKACDESDSEASQCDGQECPFKKPSERVFQVYYCTVEHGQDNKTSATNSPASSSSNFKYCSSSCPSVKASQKTLCSKSACSSAAMTKDTDDSKCETPSCRTKQANLTPSPADSDVVLDLANIYNSCGVKTCDVAEKVKDLIVDLSQQKKSKVDTDDPCYCDCVCDFKFSNKTTYCAVCGGYESLGTDMKDQPEFAKPHPCPVYHKLYDKKYIKVNSPWPEEDEKKKQNDTLSLKSMKTTASKTGASSDKKLASSRSAKSFTDKKEEETKTKKPKQEKKKIGKFTANVEEEQPVVVEKKQEIRYPYPPVPKNMGWNWTAEDIPGMKPRPKWKPGAANKILVRRYRALREGVDVLAKKKRAQQQRKKKIELKPTIVVTKKDGEYTVQMEVLKQYSKERLVHQFPYEEKQPLVYTIGKTEEEKVKIQKRRERKERRETRRKSRLLQSTFRDKCQEICLKAYNQAIGLLPPPNPNDPDCPCSTQPLENLTPPIDSCSCSDEASVSSSDTDGDEWTIEFSPPAAKWDAKAKHPPLLNDNETQYTYLDYKVKLVDKHGSPVPRFFKGPDGKQECSDLGGFWGPDHFWMEINKDGYIGPDNRWVPMNFTGPDGMFYSAEEGFFTDSNGRNLKIGVDGYIDKDGKWAWYSKSRGARSGKSKSTLTSSTIGNKKIIKEVKPDLVQKSKLDEKGKSPQITPEIGAKSKKALPAKVNFNNENKTRKSVSNSVPKSKNPIVMNVAVKYTRSKSPAKSQGMSYMDPKKLAKYREIMQGLEIYDDLRELKPPMKANRASNTPRKKISPFTMHDSSLSKNYSNCTRESSLTKC